MGSGASNARVTVAQLVTGKPDDASDIKDLAQAKKEIIYYRKLAKLILNDGVTTTKDLDGKLNRGAVVDRQEIQFKSEYTPKVVPKSAHVREILMGAVTKNILFASYSINEHNAIIDAHEMVEYKAGEFVIKQGDQGDDFYIIESGFLDIFVRTPNGESKVGNQLSTGAAFGELALMYNTPRAASIKAATDCILWKIHRKTYKEIIIYHKYLRNKTYLSFLQNVEVMGKRLGSYMNEDDLEKLIFSMEREKFDPNDVIIRQGNKGNNFYILIEGDVAVYKTKEGQHEVGLDEWDNIDLFNHITTLHPGQYFGEKALMKEETRQASCVAITPVTCLTLGRDDFIFMMGSLEEITSNEQKKEEILSARGAKSDDSNLMENPMKAGTAAAAGAKTAITTTSTSSTSATSEEPIDQSTSNPEYYIDMFDMKKTVGKGAFGHVKVCSHKQNGQLYALKVQYKEAIIDNNLKNHVLDEFKIMRKFNHPYICKLYAAMQDKFSLYFLIEYLPGGELFTYLQDVGKISEHDARFYAGAVILAFNELHQPHLRVAYRDLKPENIVLTEKGLPKLVDFGLAKHVLSGKTWTMCGTPDYLAPEVILNQGHDIAVDYWTIGIFITEMITGSTPFTAKSAIEVYEKILNEPPRLSSSLSRNVIDLIHKLLRPEQGKRLGNTKEGISGIVNHKWFNSFNWEKLQNCQLQAPYVPKVRKIQESGGGGEDFDYDDGHVRACDWTPILRTS